MQYLRVFGATVLGVALAAQSPLTTTYASNNGGSVGGGVYFDLTVAAGGVTVTGLDVNSGSTASTVGTIEFWILPGSSYVGNTGSTAGWIQYASGPVTAAGLNLPTNVVFTTPAQLPAGLYGVALKFAGVSARYTNGTGANQNYSNAELSLAAGSAGNVFLSGTPFTPRVFNGSIYYNLGSGNVNFARASASGSACEFSPRGAISFYQNFATVSTFDLSNTSLLLTPAGSGYAVTGGTTAVVPPTGVGLALTDDSLSVAQTLPFTLTYPGGSTTQIKLCSNGYIWLNGTSTAADLSPTPAELLTLGGRLAPLWMDLLPDGATNLANVYYEVDPGNAFVRATWLNVPEFANAGSSNTFQVTINATGVIEIAYGVCNNISHVAITGFSPGTANRDPGSIDISASVPFLTQTDTPPAPTHSATRPVTNTTCNITVGQIPAGSLVGLELLGVVLPTPIDLTGAGLPGCSLYVSILTALPFSTAGTSATVPLPIPNDPTLVGVQVGVEGIVVNPAANTFGAVATNLITLTIGDA